MEMKIEKNMSKIIEKALEVADFNVDDIRNLVETDYLENSQNDFAICFAILGSTIFFETSFKKEMNGLREAVDRLTESVNKLSQN